MCRSTRCLALSGSISGVIQSVVWIALAATGALVYLGALPIEPYEGVGDFFRVTLVKLYFEGPTWVLDGSYLGDFNDDYETRHLLSLTPDIVFAAMIVYVIINFIQFIFSIMIYFSHCTGHHSKGKRSRDLTLGWSILTILLCAIDALLTTGFIIDIFSLRLYLDEDGKSTNVSEKIPIIPITLALISSRFIVLWVWNFVVAVILLFGCLCNNHSSGPPVKKEMKRMAPAEREPERKLKIPEEPSSVTPTRGGSYQAFDVISNPDFIDVKRSMEAVTRFNEPVEKNSQLDGNSHRSIYSQTGSLWQPSKSNGSVKWEMDNEAFVSDEQVSIAPEKPQDFDHDLKNFEQGEGKIKVLKPPIGKPVSIPIPPPLPVDEVIN